MSFVGSVLERSKWTSFRTLWKVLDLKKFFKQFIEKMQSPIVFWKGHLQGTLLLFPFRYSSSDDIYQVPIVMKQQVVLMKRLLRRLNIEIFKCEIFNYWCCSHTPNPTFFIIVWRFGAFFCGIFDGVISRFSWLWSQTFQHWQPPTLCHIWWKFEFNWMSEAPVGSGYISEWTKNPLLEIGSRLSFWQKWPNIHF